MFNSLIIKLLPIIVTMATPELRLLARESMSRMREYADSTPNQFDDALVDILEGVTGIGQD